MDFDSKRQNHCAHFCGLLRETELYTYFIFQAAPNRNRLGMSSGQSTMSEEENETVVGSPKGIQKLIKTIKKKKDRNDDGISDPDYTPTKNPKPAKKNKLNSTGSEVVDSGSRRRDLFVYCWVCTLHIVQIMLCVFST